MAEMLHRLTGIHKSLEVYEDHVVIKQKSIIDKLANGFKGDKSIYIEDITAIQIKPPGLLTNGYIQFSLPGGNEQTGGMKQATQDENSVFYAKEKHDLVMKIKSTIERQKKVLKQPGVAEVMPSQADELTKFKKLADEGVITQEEFEIKKSQILDSKKN